MLPSEFGDSCQSVFIGHGNEKRIMSPIGHLKAFDGFLRPGPDKACIEFACQKRSHLTRRVLVVHFYQASRIVLPEPFDQAGKFYIQISPDKGKAEAACFFVAVVADGPGSMVNVTQNDPGILQETDPCTGQTDLMSTAGEDFGTELFLQRLDLAGERRLGEMKLPGRLGETEVIRDGDEAFELAHADPTHAKSVIYPCNHSNFHIEPPVESSR